MRPTTTEAFQAFCAIVAKAVFAANRAFSPAATFTTATCATITAVTTVISLACAFNQGLIFISTLSKVFPPSIIAVKTGYNFSPSSTRKSFARFCAFSSSPLAVLLAVLNSFVTLVPSSKARVACCCVSFTCCKFAARVESV